MTKRDFLSFICCLPLTTLFPKESQAMWQYVLRFILGGSIRRAAVGAAARNGIGRGIAKEVAKGVAQEVAVRSVMSYLARANPQEMIPVNDMTIDGRKVVSIDRSLLTLIEQYGIQNIWFTDQVNAIHLVGHNTSPLRAVETLHIYVEDVEKNMLERQTTGGLVLKPHSGLEFTVRLIDMPLGLKRIRAEAPNNPNIKVEPTEPFLAVQSHWVKLQDT